MDSTLNIENKIYRIRGQNVMLDSDLAHLYQVKTKAFNQAVKRNIERFPEDFMFKLNDIEFQEIKKVAGITPNYGGRRHFPFVFTECGIAMLSSVLTSGRAAQVNISIMRTFIKLRSFLAMETSLSEKVDHLEKNTNQLFRVVFERLDVLEKDLPAPRPKRRKIGFHPND